MKKEERRVLRSKLFKRDGNRCWLCRCQLTKKSATLDHVIPKCVKGRDNLSNLKLACKKCNGNRKTEFPFGGVTWKFCYGNDVWNFFEGPGMFYQNAGTWNLCNLGVSPILANTLKFKKNIWSDVEVDYSINEESLIVSLHYKVRKFSLTQAI